jgi:AcrR family transcriptional regulator
MRLRKQGAGEYLSRQSVTPEAGWLQRDALYALAVPKLWTETIEDHRRTVRNAILDTAWQLASQRGALAVTMSEIAEKAGIGRATLYKYFADVEAILVACHQRLVSDHLRRLTDLRDQPTDATTRLRAVIQAYALIAHHRAQHGTPELAALVHRGAHLAEVQHQLVGLLSDLLAEVASVGRLRDDVPTEELAVYCLHALAAAGDLPSEDAVRRLVDVTLDALSPPG